MSEEAFIQINRTTLTIGQAMALRMAVSETFSRLEADPDSLGDDDHGKLMLQAYRDRLREVLKLLMQPA